MLIQKKTQDLTPFDNTRVDGIFYSKYFPGEILFTMNKRDKKVFDFYKLDLKNNELKMVGAKSWKYNALAC